MTNGRDYATEVRILVDAACTGTWSAPGVAVSVVEHLRAKDPDLLAGFLDLCAVDVIRNMVNERDRSTRSYNRKTASRSVFKEAADRHEQGDTEPLEQLTFFLQELYVVEDGTKVPLRNMRAAELNFAADEFTERARQSRMREAFLRALAKKCGDRAVGEIFTENQVAALWLSVS
jgi:hypothetical protein